jgi:hypothetical protein
VLEATAIWLLAPTAIEADFRREYHDARIAHWLTGAMSSREFLVLVNHLSDESEFKTLAPKPFGRGGDWSEAMQIAAETHKEFALYRASKYVEGPNEYVPQVFISPGDRLAAAEEAAAEAREEYEGAEVLGNMFRQAGWS